MVDAESKKRLLQFAMHRLGKDQVAARLKVSPERVDEWLNGSADITSSKALALADLVDALNRQQ